MAHSRGNWSGTLGFVLAAMGSAVGLGNVWRFSYVTGEYGGAAFILVYLGCVTAVGIPIMIAELLIGRSTQRNVVGAFSTLRPGTPWFLAGWLGVTVGFVLLSYYSVVGGWVLHYISLSLIDGFCRSIHSRYRATLSIPVSQSSPSGVLACRFYGRHHLVCLAGCLAGY